MCILIIQLLSPHLNGFEQLYCNSYFAFECVHYLIWFFSSSHLIGWRSINGRSLVIISQMLILIKISSSYLLRYPFVFVGGDNGGRPDKVVEQLFNKLQTRDQGPSAKVL